MPSMPGSSEVSSHRPLALVTGGSKGIGLAIARRFIAEGYAVVICASSQASLDAAQAQEPLLDTVLCDVTSKSDIESLVATVSTRFGTVDVLVNNAGRYLPGQIHSELDDVLEAMLNVNLKSAYLLTKRLLPPMIARRAGTIVNICSTASFTPFANGGAYCIAKFALLGFSKVLREEMKPHRVRVISVLPGATYTASWEGADIPADQFMPADDVAQMVVAACLMGPNTVIEEIVLRPMDGDIS
jgi:NAD(P)-dependent dehydrogenase (short-subunit alcohol dehydrogenase family)